MHLLSMGFFDGPVRLWACNVKIRLCEVNYSRPLLLFNHVVENSGRSPWTSILSSKNPTMSVGPNCNLVHCL